MFAPPGYVPATRLWDEFSSARLPQVYAKAAESYADEHFYAALSRGSPLDICEHIFLLALSELGVSVASADGMVLDLHVRYFDGFSGLFTTLPPMVAAGAIWNASNRDDGFELSEGGIQGRKFAAWEFKSDENDAFKAVYPESPDDLEERLSAVRFHSLPVLFDRDSFTIVKALPSWSEHASIGPTDMALIEQFGGRSLCVEKGILDASWSEYVSGSRLAFEVELGVFASRAAPAAGRPRKQEAAREAYESVFPDGHNAAGISFKAATNRVASELGYSISDDTLARALGKKK